MNSELLQMHINGHQSGRYFSHFGFAHNGHQYRRHRKLNADLPSWSEHMGVMWWMIIGIHHQPKAIGSDTCHYESKPNMMGFYSDLSMLIRQRFALQRHVHPVNHLAAGLITRYQTLQLAADHRHIVHAHGDA